MWSQKMATKQHHKRARQEASIERLEAQLKLGTRILSAKTAKKVEGGKKGDTVKLTDSDIKRIMDIIANTKNNMQ